MTLKIGNRKEIEIEMNKLKKEKEKKRKIITYQRNMFFYILLLFSSHHKFILKKKLRDFINISIQMTRKKLKDHEFNLFFTLTTFFF